MKPKILTSMTLVCALCLLAPTATLAQNLLYNPDFFEENSQGPYSTHTASPTAASGGQSGAEFWTTWAPPGGTVSTFLMPSFFPGDGGNMLAVETDKGGGLVQAFLSPQEGPEQATACVWIYLEYGASVSVGIGNGGNTHSSMTLTEKGKWERITVSNGVSPANEITIYTAGTGAYFYVTYASVSPGPAWNQYECCTPAEFGAGI
jgi:hypothetical protein